MPFKNNLIAKRLTILGSALVAGYQRARIVGTIDNLHNPQFQFFTGSPDEGGPGLVWVSCDPSFNPDKFIMIVSSPESADGSQAALNLTSNSGGLNDTDAIMEADTVSLLGGTAGNGLINIGNGGAIAISSDTALINMSAGGTRFNALGRRMVSLGGGTATPNASGGNGTIDIAHSFGNIANTFITINGEGGGTFRIFTRLPANDTGSTFQCRVINRDGTVPPNGTTINCQWNGIEYV